MGFWLHGCREDLEALRGAFQGLGGGNAPESKPCICRWRESLPWAGQGLNSRLGGRGESWLPKRPELETSSTLSKGSILTSLTGLALGSP